MNRTMEGLLGLSGQTTPLSPLGRVTDESRSGGRFGSRLMRAAQPILISRIGKTAT